jgi:aryl-alcohol dehydrogenase-like predicted oxidoreductase
VDRLEERQMGRSALFVTEVTIGTMTFGNQCDVDASFAILDRAYAAGVRSIDTADVYPLGGGPERRGETERIVGRWLKTRGVRDEVQILTKLHGATGPARHQRGLGRRHMAEAVEASLERLGVDAVDLYQAHGFDADTPLEEVCVNFDALVRSGRIRYWGVSNWRAYQLALAIGVCERLDLVRPVSVQPRYNALYRAIEAELVPLCLEAGVGILPYNPLAGGMLTGRYRPGQGVERGSRFDLGHGAGERYRERYWQPATLRAVTGANRVADRHGVPMSAAALRWVIDRPGVTSAIVGASRAGQLDESLAALDLDMPASLTRALDGLWERLPRREEAR